MADLIALERHGAKQHLIGLFPITPKTYTPAGAQEPLTVKQTPTADLPAGWLEHMTSAQQAQLDAGTLVALPLTITIRDADTGAELVQRADRIYNERAATLQAEHDKRYRYFGVTRNVP